MKRLSRRICLVLSIAVLALAVGCAGGQKKADEKPTGPTVPSYFEEIPASTMFFVGGTEPVPEELTRASLEYLRGVNAADSMGRQYEYLEAELGGSVSADGLSNIGLSKTPTFAAYSFGYTPVVRLSLADAAKFEAFVKGYDEKFTKQSEERSHDGKTYFAFEGPDSTAIYRFSDSEFVGAIVGNEDLEAFLPYFFGAEKPANSLASDNEFLAMTERYGFQNSIAGYFNLSKFARVAAGNIALEGDSARFVENGPIKPSYPSYMNADICADEFARIASWTPRLVMGFRTYSDEQVDVAMGAVLDPELAEAAQKARGEVPGYGSALMDNALVSIGLGLDLAGVIEAGSFWGRKVQQDPLQCKQFGELNTYAQQIIGAGGQAPPAISGIQGYSALLDTIRVKHNETNGTYYLPSMVTALRSEDPETLIMFASQMAPMLGSLQLQADGEPVAVEPLDAVYPGLVESTALMTSEFIGVAMGPAMADKLATMLQGEKDMAPPFFVMRARTGDVVSTVTSDLRAIIDDAEKNRDERGLTQEDITLARKYVDRIEGIFPDGEQTFEVSATLDEDTVFMNYADSGPDFRQGWMKELGEESQKELRALVKVLGLARNVNYGGPATATEVEAAPAQPKKAEETGPKKAIEADEEKAD